MFKWLKNPAKQLQKDYEAKLAEAMQAQRNGDIRRYSELSQDADKIYQELQKQQS